MPRLHPNSNPVEDLDTQSGAETEFDEGDAAMEARSDFVAKVLSAEPDDVGNVERLQMSAVDFGSALLRV